MFEIRLFFFQKLFRLPFGTRKKVELLIYLYLKITVSSAELTNWKMTLSGSLEKKTNFHENLIEKNGSNLFEFSYFESYLSN